LILLDTHVLIWMSSDPSRLSKRAREAIREARRTDGVSAAAISLWELAWLAERRRISFSGSVESFVRETVSRVGLSPLTPEIASLAVGFPDFFPKDPADRIIAATALIENRLLVTADDHIRRSELVSTVW
jgi:PIN domain nuclease of toxin-antitoxin system